MQPRTEFGGLWSTARAALAASRSSAQIRLAINSGALKAVPVKIPGMKPQWGIDPDDLARVYPDEVVLNPKRRARLRDWRQDSEEQRLSAYRAAGEPLGPIEDDGEDEAREQLETALAHVETQLRLHR